MSLMNDVEARVNQSMTKAMADQVHRTVLRAVTGETQAGERAPAVLTVDDWLTAAAMLKEHQVSDQATLVGSRGLVWDGWMPASADSIVALVDIGWASFLRFDNKYGRGPWHPVFELTLRGEHELRAAGINLWE